MLMLMPMMFGQPLVDKGWRPLLVSFSVASQAISPQGADLSYDGTTMFVIDSTADAIFEYKLSTPWDITTASYSGVSLSTTDFINETSPTDVVCDGLGNITFIGTAQDVALRRSLAIPNDLSSGSGYGSVGESVSNPTGLMWANEGYNFYVRTTSSVTGYTVTNPYRGGPGIASMGSQSVTSNSTGMWWSTDGLTFYIVNSAGAVLGATTTVPYSTSSAFSFSGTGLINIEADNTNTTNVHCSNNGELLIWTDSGTDKVYAYRLYEPRNPLAPPTTGTYTFTSDVSGIVAGIHFSPDGTKLYTVNNNSSNTFTQYALSTPWDVSTMTYVGASTLPTGVTVYGGLFIKPDGTKLYTVNRGTDNVVELAMSTPWDITTLNTTGVTQTLSAQDLTPRSIYFKEDGTKMFMIGNSTDTIYQYNLGTPWDITTITASGGASISLETNPADFFISPTGEYAYIVGSSVAQVVIIKTSEAWNFGTGAAKSIMGRSSSMAFSGAALAAVRTNPSGNRLYLVNSSNQLVQKQLWNY